MIQFARATSFIPVVDEASPIPFHKFYFTDFDQLQQRVHTTELLTDVIGVITSIQALEHININSRPTTRQTIMIQNIRNEQLQVTLWGQKTDKFEENVIKSLQAPLVAVFAAMLVKQYLVHTIHNTSYNNRNLDKSRLVLQFLPHLLPTIKTIKNWLVV
ncbi:uncharacterized protein LOC112092513 [Morus notabilis]|uniref:uncharacterized protein LOC112092513 n=1 Tax=Morus notabilis TaxID=981085 RepID=UPI000CED20C0|nr:uncharacterized protein LOC112092513 [Morus notabilis]